MAKRMSAGAVRGGWQMADDDPRSFYEGKTDPAMPVHTANLCELIRDRIRQRLNTRVSNLEVEEEAGAIVLTGRCATFHTKQLAQHAALGVLNDEPLENRIEVLMP